MHASAGRFQRYTIDLSARNGCEGCFSIALTDVLQAVMQAELLQSIIWRQAAHVDTSVEAHQEWDRPSESEARNISTNVAQYGLNK